MDRPSCRQCGKLFKGFFHLSKRYCSGRCKRRFCRQNKRNADGGHSCRVCSKWFPIKKDQGNKWICSAKCRREQQARGVREFHARRPLQQTIYRKRTREKMGPDTNLRRFYLWNPNAPRCCESCGEDRVLSVAHKPHKRRLGARRSKANSQWPKMVWVLCPTCHELLDRMNYSPKELGLRDH